MNRWWLLMFAAVFAWSAIRPADYPTWFLEVLPAIDRPAVLVPGNSEAADERTSDLILKQKMPLAGDTDVEAFVRLSNVFDQTYEYQTGLPAPGRVFGGGIATEF